MIRESREEGSEGRVVPRVSDQKEGRALEMESGLVEKMGMGGLSGSGGLGSKLICTEGGE